MARTKKTELTLDEKKEAYVKATAQKIVKAERKAAAKTTAVVPATNGRKAKVTKEPAVTPDQTVPVPTLTTAQAKAEAKRLNEEARAAEKAKQAASPVGQFLAQLATRTTKGVCMDAATALTAASRLLGAADRYSYDWTLLTAPTFREMVTQARTQFASHKADRITWAVRALVKSMKDLGTMAKAVADDILAVTLRAPAAPKPASKAALQALAVARKRWEAVVGGSSLSVHQMVA